MREYLRVQSSCRDLMIHRQLQQVDQLVRLGAEERSAEDETRLGIDDSLQQAVRLAKDLRLRDSHGLQSLDFIGATRGGCHRLRHPDLCQRRCSEDAGRK